MQRIITLGYNGLGAATALAVAWRSIELSRDRIWIGLLLFGLFASFASAGAIVLHVMTNYGHPERGFAGWFRWLPLTAATSSLVLIASTYPSF